MPFDELDTVTKENMPPTAIVSYLRFKRKDKVAHGKPRLQVYIPTVACTTKAERFKVMLGSGADKNKLRIVALPRGDKGGILATTMKFMVRMNFGFVPRFGDEGFDGGRCALAKINETTFDITLDFDPLSEEEKKALAEQVAEDRPAIRKVV